MTELKRKCYRDRDNGVYFGRQEHRHDCTDPDCRGCVPCPEEHCKAAKNCAWHIPEGELTCGRCLGSARRDLRWIGDLAPLMLAAAIAAGINSEAANLAGPSVDPAAWSERRIAMRSHLATWELVGRIDERQHLHARVTMEDDDEHHPLRVTQTWARMIAEDYGHDVTPATLAAAVGYLDRNLHRIANDDGQDFLLLRGELRKCRQHLEAVLCNDDQPDRGAPCPECVAAQQEIRADLAAREVPEDEWPKLKAPRLVRQYPHWCDDEDCQRTHHDNDSQDIWQCPTVPTHQWAHEAYTRYVEDRSSA